MSWKDNMGPERAGMLAEAQPREAREWLQQARSAVAASDFEGARVYYLKCVESWRQANVLCDGAYQEHWQEATREYESFVEKDPVFAGLFEKLQPVIAGNPGILQTELYKKLPEIYKAHMSYVLYFAAKQGKIVRKKKGRTYEISLA
ncbi:MAG: hypothetical protein ACE5IP_07790 [Terriglobia bacterium]